MYSPGYGPGYGPAFHPADTIPYFSPDYYSLYYTYFAYYNPLAYYPPYNPGMYNGWWISWRR
jgi:hypothetical protein